MTVAEKTTEIDNIVRTEYRVRYFRDACGYGWWHPGQDVTMADGSIWFHSYEGTQPRRIN